MLIILMLKVAIVHKLKCLRWPGQLSSKDIDQRFNDELCCCVLTE